MAFGNVCMAQRYTDIERHISYSILTSSEDDAELIIPGALVLELETT